MAILGATSLTGCSSIPDFFATGTITPFQQTTAPTSWTKQTTHDNKALRVVNGTASSGGTTAFTTVLASRTPAGSISVSGTNSGGSVQGTAVSTAQIASHSHRITDWLTNIGFSSNWLLNMTNTVNTNSPRDTTQTGQGGQHTHPYAVPSWSGSATFSGTALDFAVQYVDIILASKNA
jgi:hypothetical protein